MKAITRFGKLLLSIFFLLIVSVVFTLPASAIELDEATRTVPLNDKGDTTVLSMKQLTQGQRLFNLECTQCHLQGKTTTNNNVTLALEDLAKADPPRNNLEGLVDYIKNPTSYDGEDDYSELHPNPSRIDIYPELKNLTDTDVVEIAGYILVAPKIDNNWGGKNILQKPL